MPANKKTRKEQASKQEVSPTCSHTYTHQKKTQTNAQPFKQNLAASIPSESARSTSQLSPASHPRGSCCTRGESSEHISTNNKGARSRKRTQHTHNKSRGEEERREERKPPCTSTLEPWPLTQKLLQKRSFGPIPWSSSARPACRPAAPPIDAA